MKKIFLSFLFLFLTSEIVFADSYVNGYYRSDGTYVKGHYRSSPNNTKSDNWTTYGNTNPYTGEKGTRKYNDYNNYGYGSKQNNSNGSYNSIYGR